MRRRSSRSIVHDKRFAGNPLAWASRTASTPPRFTIAREVNLSETVFVFPPAKSTRRSAHLHAGARAPFAGIRRSHGVLLGRTTARGERFGLEENVGLVRPVHVERRRCGGASFDLPRCREGSSAPVRRVAAALVLSAANGARRLFPAHAGRRAPFTFVPVRGLDYVGASEFDLRNSATFGGAPMFGFRILGETADRVTLPARMFAPPRRHVNPATGSAVRVRGIWWRGNYRTASTLSHRQGYEMGRASHIELTLKSRAQATAAAIAGSGGRRAGRHHRGLPARTRLRPRVQDIRSFGARPYAFAPAAGRFRGRRRAEATRIRHCVPRRPNVEPPHIVVAASRDRRRRFPRPRISKPRFAI